MTFIRNRCWVAAIVGAACTVVPAPASADSLPSTFKSDAAQSGSRTWAPSILSDSAQSGRDAGDAAGARLPYPPDGFTGGDRNQYDRPVKSTFPPAGFRGGDAPVDHPGASRASTARPTTIEIVRPERTIVRDVDQVVALILSSTALLLALVSAGIAMLRTGMVPRLRRGH